MMNWLTFGLLFCLIQRQAVAKAEDLRQNGIDLELMHMNRPDKQFNIKTFYEV